MSALMDRINALLAPEKGADRVVPPTGFTASLTMFSSGAMAFLAVFAMALSLATTRLADRWGAELARSSTVRISAPEEQMAAQTSAVVAILETTPGVRSARALSDAEQKALLEPWFGPDLPLENLPVPQLIEVVEEGDGFDPQGLRLRLQAEAPGAALDDHTRWRRPLVDAANRLRTLGIMSLLLIAATPGAMITLAANAALSANAQVVSVLRLVGARDRYIANAFVRRFTLRAFVGALGGTLLGMIAMALLPEASTAGGFLTGLGFQGIHWFWPLTVPPLAGVVALLATRAAAQRTLKGLT